jgi:hypothetical protein
MHGLQRGGARASSFLHDNDDDIILKKFLVLVMKNAAPVTYEMTYASTLLGRGEGMKI